MSDAGSYGIGYFQRTGGSNCGNGYTCANPSDGGYVVVNGVDAASGQISVTAYATGGTGGGTNQGTISINSPVGTLLGIVHPNWENQRPALNVTYQGYTGNVYHFTIGQQGTFNDSSGHHTYTTGPWEVDVPVSFTVDNFNCYGNSYTPCTVSGASNCVLQSSTDPSTLVCAGLATDIQNSTKSQCDSYWINYSCPTTQSSTQCAQWQAVLNCASGQYPIPTAGYICSINNQSYPDQPTCASACPTGTCTTQLGTITSQDFTAQFAQSAEESQVVNELQHVFDGNSEVCESGMWWLFDNESIGAFLASAVISYATQQLGADVVDQLNTIGGPVLANLAECIGSAVQVGLTVATAGTKNAISISNPYNGNEIPTAYNTLATKFGGTTLLNSGTTTTTVDNPDGTTTQTTITSAPGGPTTYTSATYVTNGGMTVSIDTATYNSNGSGNSTQIFSTIRSDGTDTETASWDGNGNVTVFDSGTNRFGQEFGTLTNYNANGTMTTQTNTLINGNVEQGLQTNSVNPVPTDPIASTANTIGSMCGAAASVRKCGCWRKWRHAYCCRKYDRGIFRRAFSWVHSVGTNADNNFDTGLFHVY